MDKAIIVTVTHRLGAEAARRRVGEGIDRARAAWLDRIARCDVAWSGDRADLSISAFGQTVAAQIDVRDDHLRIEVRALGLFAGLLHRIGDRLIGSVTDSLRIEGPPKS